MNLNYPVSFPLEYYPPINLPIYKFLLYSFNKCLEGRFYLQAWSEQDALFKMDNEYFGQGYIHDEHLVTGYLFLGSSDDTSLKVPTDSK